MQGSAIGSTGEFSPVLIGTVRAELQKILNDTEQNNPNHEPECIVSFLILASARAFQTGLKYIV